MRNYAIAIVPITAVLFGCSELSTAPRALTAPRTASNAVVTNERDSSATTLTSCNGELVIGSYIVHTVQSATFNGPNDMVRYSADYHFHGIGTLTGAQYTGFFSIRDQQVVASANVATYDETFQVVSQGSIPNTYLDIKAILVLNADGTVTVDDVKTRERCQ